MDGQLAADVASKLIGAVIATAIPAVFGYFWGQLRKLKKDGDAMRDGQLALLRDRLIQGYNHWVEDKGYCPIYAKQSYDQMYKAYHALGGNGTATELHEAVMSLPTSKDQKGD